MKYSAVVVLGNLMSSEGQLNDESSGRMDLAIAAFHSGQTACIVTCGWAYREDSSLPIAEAMRRYAIQVGDVPEDAILTEEHSRDTVGDAVFTKRNIVVPNGWSNLLVATSDYHSARTREIFGFVYGAGFRIDVAGATTDKGDTLSQSEEGSLQAFRRTFEGVQAGHDDAIYERLRTQHPFYNGRVHPQIAEGLLAATPMTEDERP